MRFAVLRPIIVFSIVLIFFLQVQTIPVINISGAVSDDAPEVSNGSQVTIARQSDLHDVKLYFHRDGTMNTNEPSPQLPTALRDGSGVEFTLSPSLFSNLYIKPRAQVGTQWALWVELDLTAVGGPTINHEVTIHIREDTNSLASATFTLPHETNYLVPFPESKTEHTFSSGSNIVVNITASITGTGTGTVTLPYYSGNSPHGFMYLNCNQIVSTTLGAFRSDGTPGEFPPNAPEDRVISFQGTVVDSFGGYDINTVELSSTLSQFPANAVATITAQNEKAFYIYNWSYPYAIPHGEYQVSATIYDNYNNTFSDSTKFIMSSYGVHLHILEPFLENEKGKSVSFDLEVTNIGGATDTINLVASPSLSWSTQFDTNALNLAANQTGYATLTVTIPTTAEDSQINTITISATSSKDSAKTMSVEAKAKALAATGFTFELLGASQQEIDEDQTAQYKMKLVNIGQNTENYTVVIEEEPDTGWQISLSGGTSVPPGASVYIRQETTLNSGGQLTFTLSVSSNNPTKFSQDVDVKASPKSDPSLYRVLSTTTNLKTSSEISLTPRTSTQTSEVLDETASVLNYKSLDYSIDIENTGAEVTIMFSYTLPSSASNWDVSVPGELTIDENDEDVVVFTVTPSSSTPANEDDGYTITFKATAVDNTDTSALTNVVAKVQQFYRLETRVDGDKQVSGGGQEARYGISIKNQGNGKDTVSVIVSKKDWTYSWQTTLASVEQLGDILRVPIESGSSITLTIVLTSPGEARNGDKSETILIIRSEEFTVDDGKTYFRHEITTTVEKDSQEAFMDAVADLWILIILVVAVIIIAVFIKIKLKEKGTERE
jgi:hypothetical protein